MDQSNFEQQLALVPNLSIMNISQQLPQIQQTLNQVLQILQENGQRLHRREKILDKILDEILDKILEQQGQQPEQSDQQLQQNGQQLDQIRQDLLRLDRDNFASLQNSSAARAGAPRGIFRDVVANQPAEGFPATVAHIAAPIS